MTSLWSLGGFEQGGQNSIVVLQQSLWLLVGSGLVSRSFKQNKEPLRNAGTSLTDSLTDVCICSDQSSFDADMLGNLPRCHLPLP